MRKSRLMLCALATTAILLSPVVGLGAKARAAELAADPAVVKLVPASFRDSGTLVIGTDATYAPFESIDPKSHEIIGFDADLGRAIATVMGLKVKFVNTPFDDIIPSFASGKLSVAMSSIGDTKPREGVVDFVTYYWNSMSLLVPTGNPKQLGMYKMCGAKIGVERGSTEQTTVLPELMGKCGETDHALMAGSVFSSTTNAVLALSSGRIDGVLNDAPANDSAAATSAGQFVVVGPLLHSNSPGGVAIAKNSGMQPAILAAVKTLVSNGVYDAALKKWNLESIRITSPTINWASQQK
ncbi:ABC transporter substrate-binding protein [Acidisoma silvae]|uniref:ABC transporter substrate-binding protein n=1 Tax=Acidisoma silvae TaxID=2802396 RepID=A0A963YXY8_9PROT|nr:ABC transporter substrate-binding protein [Acidisoma silvae]MCB8878315.1 ABC transporter substrate-binding protein [Acidisoma silvae]